MRVLDALGRLDALSAGVHDLHAHARGRRPNPHLDHLGGAGAAMLDRTPNGSPISIEVTDRLGLARIGSSTTRASRLVQPDHGYAR
jgi:hypothetical protein